MVAKQIRKQAYKEIFKEGKSHQEVYETLRAKGSESPEELADALAAIPSRAKHEKTKALWISYAAILGLVALLRIAAIFLNAELTNLEKPGIFLLLTLLSILIPAWGIFSAFRGDHKSLMIVPLLLVLNTLRSLSRTDFDFNVGTGISLGLLAGIVLLAVLTSTRWKSKYRKTTEQFEVDGKLKSRLRIQFEGETNAEILDDL